MWEFVEFRFNWWLFNEKSIKLFLHDFLLFLLFFFLTTILIIFIIFFLFYYIFYVLNLTFFLLCVLKDTDYFILLSIKIKKKNKKKIKNYLENGIGSGHEEYMFKNSKCRINFNVSMNFMWYDIALLSFAVPFLKGGVT